MDELDSGFVNRVLICDDSVTNTCMLSSLLQQEIRAETVCINDPRLAEPTLDEQDFDLVILDLEMPFLSGFEVMQQIRQRFGPHQLPILIITGLQGKEHRNRALSEGANDFITKPLDPVEVVLRTHSQLRIHKSHNKQLQLNSMLEKKVARRTKELNESVNAILDSFAIVGELKDDETGSHVKRVGKYARVLAEGMGLTDEVARLIELAAPLHDIGKVGIPDKILLKPGKLDADERKIMEQHTLMGQQLLSSHRSDVMQMAARIAGTHHERWDGQGYHQGIKGEAIPIEGRITMIADVFDALTSRRPYKDSWSVNESVDYIRQGAGQFFDPTLVQVFLDNLEQILSVKDRYKEY